MTDTPNPGSPEAVKMGCTCLVYHINDYLSHNHIYVTQMIHKREL